jgi:hypothetical protein
MKVIDQCPSGALRYEIQGEGETGNTDYQKVRVAQSKDKDYQKVSAKLKLYV